MSYAIIRNDKLTRVDAQGSYIHNDRRSKGHSNKDIDPTRTHLNFWYKKNELTYIKLELPETPDINDIKLIKLNREKVENEIIKPKDNKIMELYQENLKLHNELSKQVNLVNTAEKYQKKETPFLLIIKNFIIK